MYKQLILEKGCSIAQICLMLLDQFNWILNEKPVSACGNNVLPPNSHHVLCLHTKHPNCFSSQGLEYRTLLTSSQIHSDVTESQSRLEPVETLGLGSTEAAFHWELSTSSRLLWDANGLPQSTARPSNLCDNFTKMNWARMNKVTRYESSISLKESVPLPFGCRSLCRRTEKHCGAALHSGLWLPAPSTLPLLLRMFIDLRGLWAADSHWGIQASAPEMEKSRVEWWL